MSQTEAFIQRLEALKEGDRSRLRRLAGMPLDHTLPGFDLFTGLWWPLREKNQFAPRRETSWLVAKLHAAFRVPHVRPDGGKGPTLPQVLACCEPPHRACPNAAMLTGPPPERDPARGQFLIAHRFRRRFDALLQSPLAGLEPHLRWALSAVAGAIAGGHAKGIDWAQLLDHLSIWDRAEEHRRERDIRDIWAEAYLDSVKQANHQAQGEHHAD